MNHEIVKNKNTQPLVVDLDGTFIQTDMLMELILKHLLQRHLLGLIEIVRWLRDGKACLKDNLSKAYIETLDVENIPLSTLRDDPVFQSRKDKYLVSGSNHLVVDKFCACYQDFSGGYGSTSSTNLVENKKAEFLKDKFPNGFDYVGNSDADIPELPLDLYTLCSVKM